MQLILLFPHSIHTQSFAPDLTVTKIKLQIPTLTFSYLGIHFTDDYKTSMCDSVILFGNDDKNHKIN